MEKLEDRTNGDNVDVRQMNETSGVKEEKKKKNGEEEDKTE